MGPIVEEEEGLIMGIVIIKEEEEQVGVYLVQYQYLVDLFLQVEDIEEDVIVAVHAHGGHKGS